METPKKQKALWIDPMLHSEFLALCDFQRRTIKSVTEHILRKAIKKEAEKNG